MRLLLALLLALAATAASAQLSTKPGEYGKTLVADVDMPPSRLDALTQAAASPSGGSAGSDSDWVGESLVGTAAASPYTIVVQVTGRAKADGDVITTWTSGWKREDGLGKYSQMHGLAAFGVKAGERLTLTAPAAPARFDRDRTAAPTLSLIDVKNFDIEHVQVQVWSGFGSPTFLQYLVAYRVALVGLVFIVVILVFRRL